MSRIAIPFLERWRESMSQGIKTCTSRTKCYGQLGDIFVVFDATFWLGKVEKMKLEDVATTLFREEGCHSPEEFIKVWEELHPRKGWDGGQKVWVHHFSTMSRKFNG